MKKIVLIVFIQLPFLCLAQAKENFLNSVYKTKVDSSFTKYYLQSESHFINLDKYETLEAIKTFSAFAPDSIIRELFIRSKSDTTTLVWNCKNLDKAECVINITEIIPDAYLVILDSKWNNRKRKKEEEKQRSKQENEQNKKTRQEKTVYRFSRPIFDKNEEYAIIEMWAICGNTCGQGCLVLFKKINETWQKVAETKCRIS